MRLISKLVSGITATFTVAMLFLVVSTNGYAADLGVYNNSSSTDSSAVSSDGTRWTGPSIGLNVGWGSSISDLSARVEDTSFASISGVGTDGWLVGGELAYDIRIPGNFVFGAFVGMDFSDIKTRASFGDDTLLYDRGESYYAGGRLGLLVGATKDVLVYGKVQYVWNTPGDLHVAGEKLSLGEREGWGVGGGVEYQLQEDSGFFGFADYTHVMYDSTCVYCGTINGEREIPVDIREETADNIFKVGLKYRVGR